MSWYQLSQSSDRIVAAAILLGGRIFSVPQPGRHHDVIRKMTQEGVSPHEGIQGFLTESGRFVNREDGARIAITSGQVSKLRTPPDLFSEDLW